MRAPVFIAAISLVFSIFGTSPARSQTLEMEGYSIVAGTQGPMVCMGNWVRVSPLQTGLCDGPLVDVPQFAAISARQTADKLDLLLEVLTSIDDKLTVSNDEMKELVKATTVGSRASTEQRVKEVGELVRRDVVTRFDALPGKIMANEELVKLREAIVGDIEQLYSLPVAPVKK
jgi:hypothetical protein